MKGWILAFLMLSVPQSPGGLDPQGLVGLWQGEGRYLNGEADRVHGPILFTVRVDKSLRGEGRVGEARIADWCTGPRGQVIRIEARLEGAVHLSAPAERDHLLLVVTDLEANRFTATFQLRCDEAFDPAPGEGRVSFRRQQPLSDPARP